MKNKTLPRIKGFNPTTFIDWERRVASIIFLAGCNFRCPYCHSSDLVLHPDELPDISPDEVKAYLKDKKGWIEGLVVTGGEPTIYESLPEFLSEFKCLGVPIKLDTNGSNPVRLRQLLEERAVDYIAMDVKAPLEKKPFLGQAKTLTEPCSSSIEDRSCASYDKITGVSIDIGKIRESIKLIKSSGIDYEFRTTVVPGQLQMSDIVSIARAISGARRYFLQQFVPRDTLDPKMMAVSGMPLEELDKMAEPARAYVPNTFVRGR